MFFLPDINQLRLGKRRWNLATCSTAVEFCLQCLPTNIVRTLNEKFSVPKNGALSPNVLVAGASQIGSGDRLSAFSTC